MDRFPELKGEKEIQKFIQTIPDQLLDQAVLMRLKKNETVAAKGAPIEYAFFVLKGELNVLIETTEGKNHAWLGLYPFTMVSDLEIFAEAKEYAASVVAAKPTLLLRIPVRDFQKAIRADSEFFREILYFFANNAYRSTIQCGNTVYRSAYEKIVAYLIEKCVASFPMKEGYIYIHQTRQMIAEELAISMRTVNRGLEKLKHEGYIQVVHGKIQLTNQQYTELLEYSKKLLTV